jgi:FolB domain-containing protein
MSEDKVEVRDLMVRGVIGVNDWERDVEQDILVNLTLYTDLRRAGESDDIDDTVNYRTIAKAVIDHIKTHQPFTVEALAADIARICLATPHVRRAQVRVEKPGALRFAHSVGVEIEREASDFD